MGTDKANKPAKTSDPHTAYALALVLECFTLCLVLAVQSRLRYMFTMIRFSIQESVDHREEMLDIFGNRGVGRFASCFP